MFGMVVEETLAAPLDFSPGVWITLVIYNSIVIVAGLVGNTLLLYGSLRHNALRMDKVSTLFIEDIAMSDLCITLFIFLPMLITLCCDGWVFGSGFCLFSAFFLRLVPVVNEMFVIGEMSVFRLWVLRKPRAFRQSLELWKVKALIVTTLVASTTMGLMYAVWGAEAHFTPANMNCKIKMNGNWNTDHSIPHIISAVLYFSLPFFLVMFSNIGILFIVVRQNNKVGRGSSSTVMIITLITWAFILSYLPSIVHMFLGTFNVEAGRYFDMFKTYMKSINVIVNPIIFLWKSKSFRDFLKDLFGIDKKKVVITPLERKKSVTLESLASGPRADFSNRTPSTSSGEMLKCNTKRGEIRRYSSIDEPISTGSTG